MYIFIYYAFIFSTRRYVGFKSHVVLSRADSIDRKKPYKNALVYIARTIHIYLSRRYFTRQSAESSARGKEDIRRMSGLYEQMFYYLKMINPLSLSH